MTWVEAIVKALMTIMPTIAFMIYGFNFFLSLFLGHMLNLILFGQISVVLRYVTSSSYEDLNEKKLKTILEMCEKIADDEGVKDVYLAGSISRYELTNSSDIDIRVKSKSYYQLLVISFKIMVFRFIANIRRLPLDIYCYKNDEFLKKLRKDEILISFNNIKPLQSEKIRNYWHLKSENRFLINEKKQ